jgi:hypothetical protein
MTLRAPLCAAAVLVTVGVAAAAAHPLETELPPGKAACYERVYDDAHLKAHPKQRVTRIILIHGGAAEGPDFYLTLKFNVRARSRSGDVFDYDIYGPCKTRGKGLVCANEWDAGAFRVEKAAGGGLLVRNLGIIANPWAYDSEDIADDAIRLPARSDDSAWKLAKVDAPYCKF